MEISKVCKSESYLENFSNMLSRNDPRNNVLCKRTQTQKAFFKTMENYLKYTNDFDMITTESNSA